MRKTLTVAHFLYKISIIVLNLRGEHELALGTVEMLIRYPEQAH